MLFAATFYKRSLLLLTILVVLAGLLHLAFFTPAAQAQTRDHMPNLLNVSLLRQKDHSGEAMLRLNTIVNVTSCAAIHPLRHKVEITNYYLDIIVEGYTMDFSTAPNNPSACPRGVQYSAADIPLDRKLIEDNGIKQIRLILDRGLGSDYYNVTLSQDRLELTPRSQRVFKPGTSPANGQISLSHWYYPENTLILTAPRQGAPQASLTADFARAHGLIPLEELMPGFTPPEGPTGQSGNDYYVDQNGMLAAKIPDSNPTAIGDGIYARRPGVYE